MRRRSELLPTKRGGFRVDTTARDRLFHGALITERGNVGRIGWINGQLRTALRQRAPRCGRSVDCFQVEGKESGVEIRGLRRFAFWPHSKFDDSAVPRRTQQARSSAAVIEEVSLWASRSTLMLTDSRMSCQIIEAGATKSR
jgi:hypothetical protein